MTVQSTLATYEQLMLAIKHRHAALIDIVPNQRGLPDWAGIEFAQLQIRLICETFAIACIVAHGDVARTQSKRFAKAYQADFIIKALEKLHPYFYPRPTRQKIEDGKVVAFEDIQENFLTKKELLSSYFQTAQFLHIGEVADVLAGKRKTIELNSAILWANKVVNLLNHHNIYLADPPGTSTTKSPRGSDGIPLPYRQIVFMMQGGPEKKPQAMIFQRVDDPGALQKKLT